MNRIIARQLKRLHLDPNRLPEKTEDWVEFLKLVEQAYDQSAEDRYLLERSLEISSHEMSERIKLNKELSLQLMQAAKLASLGTLASGIAHELNNPLQAIKGYVELLQEGNLPEDATAGHLVRIDLLTTRMAGIIKHLLRLSHNTSDKEKSRILVSDAIKEANDLLGKQLIYDQIELSIIIEHKDCFILGDVNQLFGVFQNLISNSRDAFRTQKNRGQSKIQVRVTEENNSIIVYFRDNAGGIPDSVLPKIFDPFFTTKEVGTGTGLGLSLSKQAIEENSGNLSVKVENGETLFILSFPKCHVTPVEKASVTLGELAELSEYQKNEKKILTLLVDDEKEICDFIQKRLSNKMDMTMAHSGTEALEILKNSKFDLLITDIRMPGASGLDVARLARELNPNVKLVIISGHLGSNSNTDLKGFEPYLLVEKPFASISSFYSQVMAHITEQSEEDQAEKKAA